MTESYASGESFTVQGPPMVWDTAAGTFIVDVDQADLEGWYTRVLRDGRVIWVKDFAPRVEERES